MSNYIAGNGITIQNNTISSKTISANEIGSFKVDGDTIYTDNNNVIHAKKEQKITLSDYTLEIALESTTVTVVEHIGDGTLSVSSSDTDIVTASISGDTITITGIDFGDAVVTVSASATSTYLAESTSIAITVRDNRIFGVSWDGSSSTTMTRTDDSASFTDPNPYYSGMSGTPSSPFDNIMPWAGMQIVEDDDAGTVVSIPKFYYQYVKSGTTFRGVRISNVPQEGFSVSPAHMNRGDGKGERDVIYVGRYHCANSTYKSTSGVKPQTGMARATARTNVHNLGSDIWQWDLATRITIWMLYLVEYANWNSQTKIGYGCGDGSAAGNMGYTNNMPYHTGTTQTSRTTYGLGTQYRYIEGLWDNVFDWVDGIRFSSSTVYVYNNPSTFSDSSGGTSTGITRPTNSYEITGFGISSASGIEWSMYTSSTTSNSSYNTYVCDRCRYNSSGVVLCAGGSYSTGSAYGLFFLYGNTGANESLAGCGTRLMKLP